MVTVSFLPETVTLNKRIPVRPHARAFQRAYLSNLLSSHFDLPLVVVEAPRGFGKTTLLASMAHRANANVRWLTLDEKDRDLNTCVTNLCSALYNVQMGGGANIGGNISQSARLIVSAFRELSVDTLILDNYEAVYNADSINGLLEQVVSELPPLTQVVIATQKTPPFKRSGRLRFRLTEVTQSDLRFDVDDVASYFETIARYRLSPAEASMIVQRTDGQPVSVNLLSQLAYGLQSYLRINFDALRLAPGEQTLIFLLREVIKRSSFQLDQAAQILTNLQLAMTAPPTAADEPVQTPSLAEATAAALPLLEQLATQYCLVHELSSADRTLSPHPMLFDLGSLL
ncbi:MAG: hypothetical protein K1Y36_27595 [Blastocatellia bacterium]|nr:hypothetical protein [Blastocatellia bacterium]